jgi:hypothetical protein
LVEDLLTSFLKHAVGLEMHERILKMEKLPKSHRLSAQPEANGEPIWVAWVTEKGVVSATGSYDDDQSRRLGAHVMLIEWWIPPGIHHSSWWRANPRRPSEWTAGRSRPS